ncbi:MAG: neutral/alkaline non-lysosomal ceramidase N-terminal domain-containing protein, partial [Vicinamibacteraceae bacterium]
MLCLLLAGAPSDARGIAQPSRGFRAGAAMSNVTPWLGLSINGGMQDRKVEHIHDELHARALVLDDGATRLAMVVVDSCMIPRSVFDEAKRRVHASTGIPVANLLMSATHTHSAPTAGPVFQSEPDRKYLELLTVRIADAVRRAVNNVEPAEIAWGVGRVPGQVFNRRWKMRPGTIPPNPFGEQDLVQMNPPVESSDLVEPAGPTDPDLTIISVRALDGRPIALFANYSLHYVGGTGENHASADYFGMFARRMEELLRPSAPTRRDGTPEPPPFVAALSNGTSGNINNVDFRQERPSTKPYVQMQRVAHDVADEAMRVYEMLEHERGVGVDARTTELTLGVRLPSAEDLDRARRIVAQADGPNMQAREEIYARETLFLSEYPARVPVILQALRIGTLVIGAIPCEVFVEIGLELKKKSPFPHTFTTSLANGYNGYLPPPEHHELGGYETWRARSSYLET